jgi:hypothetical protein
MFIDSFTEDFKLGKVEDEGQMKLLRECIDKAAERIRNNDFPKKGEQSSSKAPAAEEKKPEEAKVAEAGDSKVEESKAIKSEASKPEETKSEQVAEKDGEADSKMETDTPAAAEEPILVDSA